MEVSHASTETQSAALGIMGKAEAVTVTVDPEFMMMIAHGIYSNKALALVRELLCNARDGHIKKGTPDAPIHVTLTDNKLVVRDHGTGIPNDKFAAIYMTFGSSTKRKSKNETGGFGVGSKVPWAVCDTFSSRNYIDGTMTAYSVMKSDPAMDGGPSCTPVMCVPSKDPSGVEVSVPFPEKMYRDIKSCLHYFIQEIGLNIVLNGEVQLLARPEELAELRQHKFVRLDGHPQSCTQQTPFYVRVGDVIYPIELQEEFNDAYNMLHAVNHSGTNPILFLAEGDTIVPTMSRESLQYTARTCATIRLLMSNMLQALALKIDDYAVQSAALIIEQFPKTAMFSQQMWSHNYNLAQFLEQNNHHVRDKGIPLGQHKLLMNNMMRWLKKGTPYMETAVTIGKTWREFIVESLNEAYVNHLKTYPYFKPDMIIKQWKGIANPSQNTINAYDQMLFWMKEKRMHHNIITDVLVVKSPSEMRYISGEAKSYFLSFSEVDETITKDQKDYEAKAALFTPEQLERAERMRSHPSEKFRHYSSIPETMAISKAVVLISAWKSLLERNGEYPGKGPSTNPYTSSHGNLVGARIVRTKTTVKPDEIAALKLRYEQQGYVVYDLTGPTRAEIAERERLAAERAALRDTPLPTLIGMIDETLHPRRDIKIRKQLKSITKNPKFLRRPLYMILDRGKQLPHQMNNQASLMRLIKYSGTDIVCVSTKPEIAKVIKEGRESVDDVMLEIAKRFFSWPDMHEKMYYRGTMFARRAEQNKYLTQLLFKRLPKLMTEEEEAVLADLLHLKAILPRLNEYLSGHHDDERKIRQIGKLNAYKNCAPERHYLQVFEQYADTHFTDVLRALDKAYSKRPSRKRAIARTIMKTILCKGSE